MFIILFVTTATLDRLLPYWTVLNCFHLLWLYLLYPLLRWLWRLLSWLYSIAFTFTLTCITFNLYCYCSIVLLLPTLCPFSLYCGLHNGQNCCNVYSLVKFHYYFPPLVMMSWKEDSPCFLLKSWFAKIPRILIPVISGLFLTPTSTSLWQSLFIVLITVQFLLFTCNYSYLRGDVL